MKKILVFISLVFVLLVPYFVFAQTAPMKKLQEIQGGNSGYSDSTNLMEYLGTLVTILFSLLGVIFISLMLYSGFNWMTARGDEGKVETAQKTIMRAVIGLVITVSSYALWAYVFKFL